MKYRYIGGSQAVIVYISGANYEVERGGVVDVPANALDNHPEFERVADAPAPAPKNIKDK